MNDFVKASAALPGNQYVTAKGQRIELLEDLRFARIDGVGAGKECSYPLKPAQPLVPLAMSLLGLPPDELAKMLPICNVATLEHLITAERRASALVLVNAQLAEIQGDVSNEAPIPPPETVNPYQAWIAEHYPDAGDWEESFSRTLRTLRTARANKTDITNLDEVKAMVEYEEAHEKRVHVAKTLQERVSALEKELTPGGITIISQGEVTEVVTDLVPRVSTDADTVEGLPPTDDTPVHVGPEASTTEDPPGEGSLSEDSGDEGAQEVASPEPGTEGFTALDLQALLAMVAVGVSLENISVWGRAQWIDSADWARAVHYAASDNDVIVPPKPSFLPGEPIQAEFQNDEPFVSAPITGDTPPKNMFEQHRQGVDRVFENFSTAFQGLPAPPVEPSREQLLAKVEKHDVVVARDLILDALEHKRNLALTLKNDSFSVEFTFEARK